MNNLHPTYPYPIVRETVCEIHFRLSTKWDNFIYSRFFKKIETQFSTFQPGSVIIQVSNDNGGEQLLVPQFIRYQHNERNLLLQVSENRITVNILPLYPGWHQVVEDVKFAWNNFKEVAAPSFISRIGLRYINEIERSSEDESLGKWLIPSNFVPQAILESVYDFSSRTTSRLDENNRIQVTLANQAPRNNSFGAYIFDIDRILEKEMPIETNQLVTEINTLHDDAWNIFQSAKSPELEKLLKGELL